MSDWPEITVTITININMVIAIIIAVGVVVSVTSLMWDLVRQRGRAKWQRYQERRRHQ
ncbi:hypothetical protein [Spongiactinospora rosea]|uniref:hypothetical protein n=1 Tax=Spongiactinospora rosea TaxID=2248750 RepID=UPI0013143427|nr:hypothetical protein [Spongiactinospora rosea]